MQHSLNKSISNVFFSVSSWCRFFPTWTCVLVHVHPQWPSAIVIVVIALVVTRLSNASRIPNRRRFNFEFCDSDSEKTRKWNSRDNHDL